MSHVHDLPQDFVGDLRNDRAWPALEESLWRAPHLVRLTYGQLWQLVADVLPDTPARILDVGSGTGVLALEMARAGHEVVGLEPDETMVELARRTVPRAGSGRLTYHQAEVEDWEPGDGAGDGDGGFDVVVTTRVLHHVVEPAKAVGRMRSWLRPGGRLVVVDFLYDRFDGRAARWQAQGRGLLEAAGWFRLHDDDPLPTKPGAAVRRIESDWRREHEIEDALNRADEILEPLHDLFVAEDESWHPYLYWDLLVGLRTGDPSTEEAIARHLMAWETTLLSAGDLPSVLVRFVGTPRS